MYCQNTGFQCPSSGDFTNNFTVLLMISCSHKKVPMSLSFSEIVTKKFFFVRFDFLGFFCSFFFYFVTLKIWPKIFKTQENYLHLHKNFFPSKFTNFFLEKRNFNPIYPRKNTFISNTFWILGSTEKQNISK